MKFVRFALLFALGTSAFAQDPQFPQFQPEPVELTDLDTPPGFDPPTEFAKRLSAVGSHIASESKAASQTERGAEVVLLELGAAYAPPHTALEVNVFTYPNQAAADRALTLGQVGQAHMDALVIEQRRHQIVMLYMPNDPLGPKPMMRILDAVWTAQAKPGHPLAPVRTRLATFAQGGFVVDTLMDDALFVGAFGRIKLIRENPFVTHAEGALRRVQFKGHLGPASKTYAVYAATFRIPYTAPKAAEHTGIAQELDAGAERAPASDPEVHVPPTPAGVRSHGIGYLVLQTSSASRSR